MTGVDTEQTEIADKFANSGSNQTGMRLRNERLVLTILRSQGPLPKAEIARMTGLSAQTVSVIMRALERDGLLEKGEKMRGKVGQPSVPMRLAPGGAFFLGLKVGRRSAELLLVDFVGTEVAHVTQRYKYPTPSMTMEFVCSAVEEVCQALPEADRARIAGMGIASPFFLWEWAENIGVEPNEMAAWKGFDLRNEVAGKFDFPVFMGNDATSACGAELTFGTAETPPDFLYVYIGYFVGGGIALNGSLFTGRTGNAGAIGPYPVFVRGGAQKQLVDTASLIGLERRLAERLGHAKPMEDPQVPWEIDPDIVADWLDEIVPSLCQMIVGAISIIDFPTVLIDGNMPEALRQQIVDRVAAALQDMELSGLTRPEILTGSLGPRARTLGAASLPLSNRFLLEA